MNFISNAIKFTDENGSVKIVLSCENLTKAVVKNGQVCAS